MELNYVSVNRWIVFNWNEALQNRLSVLSSVSVNRWIVFNWNWKCCFRFQFGSVSVNRWIVFNWNYTEYRYDQNMITFQLIVG